MTQTFTDHICNLHIINKFQQIGSCSVDYFNLTPSEAAKIVEGGVHRVLINGRLVFTGFIKRIDKDDSKDVWHVTSESAVCKLRDAVTQTDRVYKNAYFDSNIINPLLPSGWRLDRSGVTEPLKISYHVTPGSVLRHIVNLCRLAEVEWEVTQDWSVDGTDVIYGDYVLRISDFIGSQSSTKTYTNTWATSPLITQNITDLVCNKNEDKISTHIQAVGSAAESSNLVSEIKFDTKYLYKIKYGDNYSESTLASSMSTTQATISISNPMSYVPECYIEIDSEVMKLTAYGSVARAERGTTATTHATGADILNLSKLTLGSEMFYAEIPATKSPLNPGTWASTTSLPATYPTTYEWQTADFSHLPADSGTVFVGQELIYYSKRSGGVLKDLQRGCIYVNDDGTLRYTKKYPHKSGTLVREYVSVGALYNYDLYAAANTPASVYGIRKRTVDVMGVVDQDGVDKKAGQVMIALADPYRYGSFTYLNSDVWRSFTLGDKITIAKRASRSEPDKETFLTRIIGIEYDMYKPVKIYYGDVDELILDDFAKADTAFNVAVNKNDNAYKTKILAVDPNNSNVVQVKLPDGTTGWIEVV